MSIKTLLDSFDYIIADIANNYEIFIVGNLSGIFFFTFLVGIIILVLKGFK